MSSRPPASPAPHDDVSGEALNDILPNYGVLDLLGRGGMGAVYKARQVSLDRIVAIKLLPREILRDDLDFQERFKQEAQTMAKLSHPGIVAVHDFGQTEDGQLFFVMEFIDGQDLAKRIEQRGALPVEEALRIFRAVADALSYAHSEGVIHRDIKPANVLIKANGEVKVADFGLAKLINSAKGSGLTRTNVAMGTQEFAAPEQLKPGAMVDHRADIYSLGVTLYQMLTGEVPRVMFKLPSLRRPELGTRFDALICKALETDPADRFQTVEEFRRALDAERIGDQSTGGKASEFKADDRRHPSRALIASVMAGAMAIAVVGWLLLGHRQGHASLSAQQKITTTPPALSPSTLPHSEWIKLLDTPEAVARSGIAGLELKDGWLTVTPERLYLFRLAGGKGKVHDMAFRARVRPPTNERPVAVVLHTGGDLEFFLDVHREWLTLRRVKHFVSSKREDTDLGKVPLDLREAQDGALQLEVSIQGNLITVMGNGAKVMEVRDEVAAGIGDIALVAPSETKGSGKIKDLAFKLLDESTVSTEAPGRTSAATVPAGSFRPLFDGKSLDGWLALNGTSPPDGWGVVDGAMTGKGYSAVLTREEFGDFELTLEWRVNPQGNGGIYYRVTEDGMVDHPLHAMEFNLMDDDISAPPQKQCGAAFGIKAPSVKAARPAGEWNTARLLVQGTKVEQWINDRLVCSYDLAEAPVSDALDAVKIGREFSLVKKGRIALQDWTGEAFYRNVRIREIR